MRPRISIIVCTKNRPRSLELTLQTIGRVAVPEGWEVELVVIDNGPEAATKAAVASISLSHISIRYLEEPRNGKSYGCNRGVAESDGDILLFTDDDIRVPTNWLVEMCLPIVEGKADAVQGGVTIPSELDRAWLTGALRVWLAEVVDTTLPPEGLLVGANMAVSRNALRMVNGFNNRLGPGACGGYEDTLLGWNLREAGRNIFYNPRVTVEHHFSPERLHPRSFINAAKAMAVSRSVTEEILEQSTRPSISSLLTQIPGFAFRCLTQAITYAAYRQPDPGFVVRYYLVCLWIARRYKVQRPSELPWLFR